MIIPSQFQSEMFDVESKLEKLAKSFRKNRVKNIAMVLVESSMKKRKKSASL